MKRKFSKILGVGLALVLALSLSLVMAVPVSATHTSSTTIDFATGALTVTGTTGVILDVEVTNNGASAGNITTVEIDFTASDFTVTDVGVEPASWTGGLVGSVVTYTHTTGIAPGASVIFVPVVTNPAEAGAAAVPAVSTTDAGSQAALAAAMITGWIAYVADSAGIGGNDITVAYVDPGMVSQSTILVSVVVKAITVTLQTDGTGAVISTATAVASAINAFTALVDATADSGHTSYTIQPLTVPAFTGGTSPDVDKASTVSPATLMITGVAPEVTGVSPAAGNVGDTMWVEVTGTDFTGTTTTSTTSFAFGTGVSVVPGSYHWIDDTEVDVQITITAAGTASFVIPTTPAGVGTNTTAEFDPNAAGIPQVDVWTTYTPTDIIFNAATLDFQVTTATISAAITAATTGDTLIVHADTYVEELVINQDITLQSLSGAASTIIDVSAAQNTANPTTSIGIEVTVAGVTITGFTIIGVPTVTVSTAIGFTVSSGAYPTIKGSIGSGALNLIVQDNIFTVPSGKVGHSALLVLPSASGDISAVKFLDNEVANYVNGVTGRMNGAYGVNDLLVEGNTFNQSTYLEDPDYLGTGLTFYLAKAVQLWEGDDLKVIDNTFTGPATLESGFGTDDSRDIVAIQDVGASHGESGQLVTYTGNTITNYSYGIFTASGGTITKNNINATTVGISVGQKRKDSAMDITAALTISQNNITNSLNRGIWVQNTGSNAVTVKYNTIAGNANYGLTNEIVSGTATAGTASSTLTDTSLEWGFVDRGVLAGDRVVNVTTGKSTTVTETVTAYQLTLATDTTLATFSAGDSYRVEAKVDVAGAKYNWWGAFGGPSADAGEMAPLGNGDVLSSQMDANLADTVYDPWLTEPQATVIADGIRSYGSDAILLEEGWNTLSVPVGLKTIGDTFGDIVAMGDYLDDYVGGYWYNASTSMWVGIDSTTTLEPGKGFYIQMSAAGHFPVLYFDGGLHLPTYDLSAGWNLVGSMFGIDRTENGNGGDADYGVAAVNIADGKRLVRGALASIRDSVSVVISPSVPGQEVVWSIVPNPENSTIFMIVGEAYWVFMGADGTLAGFEVTPFYFTY